MGLRCLGLSARTAPMATERFPKAKFRRRLYRMGEELREWATRYATLVTNEQPGWLQERFEQRSEQLLEVAHTVERARYELEGLPRLS